MKFIKKALIIVVILLMTGCFGSKENSVKDEFKLSENYQNMVVGRGGISGYMVDLRISGKIKEQNINKIIRVTNENDINFAINIIDALAAESGEEVFYIIDDVKYVKTFDGEYVQTTMDVKFDQPNLILEGINNIVEETSSTQEIIAGNEYQVYVIKVKKDVVDSMLENGEIDLVPKDDVETKVYIDGAGYIFRIIYYVDDLVVNASFYAIDDINPIILPE